MTGNSPVLGRPVVQAKPERASHPVDRPLLSLGIEQDHVVDEETALPRPPPSRGLAVKEHRVAGAAASVDALARRRPVPSVSTFPAERRVGRACPRADHLCHHVVGKRRLRPLSRRNSLSSAGKANAMSCSDHAAALSGSGWPMISAFPLRETVIARRPSPMVR